ncbi:piggyBac transposable element-derived protein 3-like [Harmonia axyridis]|uniref:piggyBac transposable element-derived protein 3-like n=1 Tax=Harmonia axyridis TaxID=115357 RepID=UPI001E27807F|nr:piggyBac transposable element-derived protein 3-like [Harmonia axyridis]
MSLARFSFLLSCIRFDDDSTREERLKENKLAAISELFSQFVQNSKSCYSPFLHLTIDEMLVPFRGCCGFRMFMPSKPAKYGIKIQLLADAKTHYMVNSEIYCGKQTPSKACLEKGEKLSLPTQVVMRLIEPVKGSNRNITTDNWYTSLELANALKKEKLTLVGTLRKNKAFIPLEFLPSRGKEIGSSLFGFTSDLTIVAHVPKKNKSVILLSSMHSDDKVDEKSKKPDIILYYNSTKAGVDALDQKCANYTANIGASIIKCPGVRKSADSDGSDDSGQIGRLFNIASIRVQIVASSSNVQAVVPKILRRSLLADFTLASQRPPKCGEYEGQTSIECT